MTDQSPPPKPKPGSLRDRIAAFEKPSSGAEQPATSPPPPRPKPGHLQWKPRPTSPPPPASDVASPGSDGHPKAASGMSASDAKESIGKGVSLKERMAMLQGKGAFGSGSGATPPPPKPATEKPKWKPPPRIVPAEDEEGDVSSKVHERINSPPITGVAKSPEGEDVPKPTESREATAAPEDEEAAADVDAEEEERQRRAAIAARMARLGGARLGMGPPIFGRPVPAKKVETPRDDALKEVEAKTEEHAVAKEKLSIETPTEAVSEQAPTPPKADALEPGYFDATPLLKNSSTSSLLSPESVVSHPSQSPSSMPIPAVPRRAGPPRRKTPKSPSPAPAPAPAGEEPLVSSEIKDVLDAAPPLQGTKDVDDHPHTGEEPSENAESEVSHQQADVEKVEQNAEASVAPVVDAPEEETRDIVTEDKQAAPEPPHVEEPNSQEDAPLEDVDEESLKKEADAIFEDTGSSHALDVQTLEIDEEANLASVSTLAVQAEPIQKEESQTLDDKEPEEDEATRRARVAKRLAQMGGFNPFSSAPPPPVSPSAPSEPPRKESTDSAGGSVPLASPVASSNPERRSSFRESSQGSSIANVHLPVREGSDLEWRSSVGSVRGPPPPVRRESRPIVTSSVPVIHAEEQASEPVEPKFSEEPEEEEELPHGQDDIRKSELDDGLEGDANQAALDEVVIEPQIYEADSVPQTQAEHLLQAAIASVKLRESQPLTPSGNDVDGANFLDIAEPQPDIEDEEEEEVVPPPPPRRPSVPLALSNARRDESSSEFSSVRGLASPVSPTAAPRRSMPPVPSTAAFTRQQENIPPVSNARASSSMPQPILQMPVEIQESPKDDLMYAANPELEPIDEGSESQAEDSVRSAMPRGMSTNLNVITGNKTSASAPVFRNSSSVSAVLSPVAWAEDIGEQKEHEVLDESEGDPIDPAFHSPRPSPRNLISPLEPASPRTETFAPEGEDDSEQVKPVTIAERMARLGGVRLGEAPLPRAQSRPRAPQSEEVTTEQPEVSPERDKPEEEELTEEEEEQARKQRIAVRLAHMGGMRFGMLPAGTGARNLPQRQFSEDELAPPPLHRVPPPPRPAPFQPTQPLESDSEFDSFGTSDDGVRVEAEESELEEVQHDEAQEEETPPPIPSRSGRGSSVFSGTPRPPVPRTPSLGPPPVPTTRPPVAHVLPIRKDSLKKNRRASTDSNASAQYAPFAPQPAGEYVMVEEPGPDDLPPPPPRPARMPPSRGPPAAPSSAASATSAWELPPIPKTSLDLGASIGDMSLSTWSEDSTAYPLQSEEPQQQLEYLGRRESQVPPMQKQARPEEDLNSEQLMALWGKIGIHVCEFATALFEQSKRALIGDGSYIGFVNAVLDHVPNARPLSPPSYGYLIYSQTASVVSRRTTEIMPGDAIVFYDAKLKGHKGLQTYHQSVGVSQPLVGVISEFDPKKSKAKVFQANQHVGQQTVENVSYRLEDLKSGTVKVFRILDA